MAIFSSDPRLPRELECKIFEMAALSCPTTIPKLMLVARRVKYWMDPRLPRELECKIFKMAGLARPTTIPNLILVARRVKYWVEPLLYRVLVLSSAGPKDSGHGFPVMDDPLTLRLVMARKPSGFSRKTVKRIFIRTPNVSYEQMEWVLTACGNVFDLCTPRLSCRAIAHLYNLRRLAVPIDQFLDCCRTNRPHPILSNITHLDLHATSTGRSLMPEDFYQCLYLVSNLTHLALCFISQFQTAPLCANTHLKCILFVDLGPPSAIGDMWLQDPIVRDPRFVYMARRDFYSNWLLHGDTGRDFWALADAFIAARRQGKVERSRFTLSDEETSWLDSII
ncbi:hypothetical protein MSAN_02044600 [Mycena sanguinolenta]|uniref:Uncharacterized protein n=1 Tax=Mycena sanguinolenta TaxID=230812 RepID=A0A8H7CLC1_9AGAR|nr:hypothetical protein MSAN_02044600 [Mycena sanguinolenta]